MPAGVLNERSFRNSDGVNPKFDVFVLKLEDCDLLGSTLREVDDVEIERELALARFRFSNPSSTPIACQSGRGVECRDVYLSSKIKGVDHIRNSVGSYRRRTVHDVEVKMRSRGVASVSQFSQNRAFFYRITWSNLNGTFLQVRIVGETPSPEIENDVIAIHGFNRNRAR